MVLKRERSTTLPTAQADRKEKHNECRFILRFYRLILHEYEHENDDSEGNEPAAGPGHEHDDRSYYQVRHADEPGEPGILPRDKEKIERKEGNDEEGEVVRIEHGPEGKTIKDHLSRRQRKNPVEQSADAHREQRGLQARDRVDQGVETEYKKDGAHVLRKKRKEGGPGI